MDSIVGSRNISTGLNFISFLAWEVRCGCIQVINDSLWEGVVLQPFKEAMVHSLVKRPSLDSILLDNFYPVSNFIFLGKIVENVVMWQLQRFLDEMDYLDLFQIIKILTK